MNKRNYSLQKEQQKLQHVYTASYQYIKQFANGLFHRYDINFLKPVKKKLVKKKYLNQNTNVYTQIGSFCL